MIDAKYFRQYKEKLGLSSQKGVKNFFAAKDTIPAVDYDYMELLNARLCEIVGKIDALVAGELRLENLDEFCAENVTKVFETLKANGIIPKLNNQGRRPEEVYFSWMRGLVISNYFQKAISYIFEVKMEEIKVIGDDDYTDIKTFKRTPKADLQIVLPDGRKIRIEMQAGFQGTNDIKQHKVLEARKMKREETISSWVLHFDLFSGQVAFVQLDSIDDEKVKWETRQQMEGQKVFSINHEYFIWKLTEMPPKFSELVFA